MCIMSVSLLYGCASAWIKERADAADVEKGCCSTQSRNVKQNLQLYSLSALFRDAVSSKTTTTGGGGGALKGTKGGHLLPSISFLKSGIISKLPKSFRRSLAPSQAQMAESCRCWCWASPSTPASASEAQAWAPPAAHFSWTVDGSVPLALLYPDQLLFLLPRK